MGLLSKSRVISQQPASHALSLLEFIAVAVAVNNSRAQSCSG